jgi:hypothetical protein
MIVWLLQHNHSTELSDFRGTCPIGSVERFCWWIKFEYNSIHINLLHLFTHMKCDNMLHSTNLDTSVASEKIPVVNLL